MTYPICEICHSHTHQDDIVYRQGLPICVECESEGDNR